MSLLSDVAVTLERARYDIAFVHHRRPSFIFEDTQLIGFAAEFASLEDLLSNWEGEQDEFLRRNTFSLRKAGYKSWNIYFVLVCSIGAHEREAKAAAIEEDFRGARKIVLLSPADESELIRGLFPLLPIQNNIRARDEDVRALLFDRLDLPSEIQEAIGMCQ